MDIQELQDRAAEWNIAYKPRRKRTPEYTAWHFGEEVGEMLADWRAGKIDRTFAEDRYGLQHPEGLGSELADVMIFCAIIAEMNDLDLELDIRTKLEYLEDKLAAKKVEKGYVPWHG